MLGQGKFNKKIADMDMSLKADMNADRMDAVFERKDEYLINLARQVLDTVTSKSIVSISIGPQVDNVEMEDYKYIENLCFGFLEEITAKGLIKNLDNLVKTEYGSGLPRNTVYAVFGIAKPSELRSYLINYISQKDLERKFGFLSYQNGILEIKGQRIKIFNHIDSDSDKLLTVIFKDKYKKWPRDEMYLEWGYMEDEDIPKQKMYQAGMQVNKKIEETLGIAQFLNLSLAEVSINKDF